MLNIVLNKLKELDQKSEFKLMKEKCYMLLLEETTLQLRLNQEYLTVKNTSELKHFVTAIMNDFFEPEMSSEAPADLAKNQIEFAKYLSFTYVFSSSLEVMAILLKNGMTNSEESMEEFKAKMSQSKSIDVESFKLNNLRHFIDCSDPDVIKDNLKQILQLKQSLRIAEREPGHD